MKVIETLLLEKMLFSFLIFKVTSAQNVKKAKNVYKRLHIHNKALRTWGEEKENPSSDKRIADNKENWKSASNHISRYLHDSHLRG